MMQKPAFLQHLTESAKRKADSGAAPCSAAGVTTPKGVCIVCGSVLLLQFWRGHPDNKKVHCNDCGSEVTLWMHEKKQPTAPLRIGNQSYEKSKG